jgi:hypothetical protein
LQFLRQLDHLCKVGNRVSDRRFKFGDISDTAESMDAYAINLARANRYIQRWDREHHFYKLDPAEPKDIRGYARYKRLTRQLRNFSERVVVAARHHDFQEIVRLLNLEAKTRNQRTRVTAGMGLHVCGA